jgi:Co/Zn/Cd efflux system component
VKKVYVLAALMAALIIVVISVWLLLPSPQKYLESFENGMGVWVADADVPEDPNNPG